MKICYRTHCGSFTESMQTKLVFENFFDLVNYLDSEFCSCIDCFFLNFKIVSYSYDFRLDSFTFLVLKKCSDLKFYPIGFIWFE